MRLAAEAEANQMRAIMCIAIQGEKSAKVVKALKGFPESRTSTPPMGAGIWSPNFDQHFAGFSQALDQIRLIEEHRRIEKHRCCWRAPNNRAHFHQFICVPYPCC